MVFFSSGCHCLRWLSRTFILVSSSQWFYLVYTFLLLQYFTDWVREPLCEPNKHFVFFATFQPTMKICVASWVLAAGLFMFWKLNCVTVVFSGSWLAGIVVTLFGKRETLFCFFWFVACVLTSMFCLFFLLVPFVGYVLWLWLFLDVFYTIFQTLFN